MDASVRSSLKNLQGLLDEGWVTKAEFNQRRKGILDAATAVEPAAASAGASKASVFSRLGEDATGTTGHDGKWKHDRYDAMQRGGGGGGGGGKSGRKVVVVQHNSSTNIRKPLAGAISKPKGDLRSKLSGGAKPTGQKKQLPAKCPW